MAEVSVWGELINIKMTKRNLKNVVSVSSVNIIPAIAPSIAAKRMRLVGGGS